MTDVQAAPVPAADPLGAYDPPRSVVLAKVKASVDDHAGGFLRAARMAVLGLRGDDGRLVPLMVGTAPGAVRVPSPTVIELPLPHESWPPERLGEAAEVGGLFIVPGVKETLRVRARGRVAPAGGGGLLLRLEVETLFFHCAKAFMRSRVWDGTRPAPTP